MSFGDFYRRLSNNSNNISNWFPKIEKCGLAVPKTCIIKVPENIVKAFFMEPEKNETIDTLFDRVYDWVDGVLVPTAREEIGKGLWFMKNGCFSNKYNFNSCCVTDNSHEITTKLIDINYTSLMFDTGGNTEVAIRERILFNENTIPCIYNGMPLRPEYRIFYDFDNHKLLYSVNYWDWDYCHDAISRNATDKIVYEYIYDKIYKEYTKNKTNVEQIVDSCLKNITELKGKWSIDILDAGYELYLIDMAIAENSAYWNPDKCYKQKTIT